jgi:hypothetical protein
MWSRERGAANDWAAKRQGGTRAERSRRDPKYHTRVTGPMRRPTSRIIVKEEKETDIASRRQAPLQLGHRLHARRKNTMLGNQKNDAGPVKVTCGSTTNAATPWSLELLGMGECH